ncbi:MAG: xanthine dehydrogenase family protein subunit M [Ardenticatenaceae bacterium]|nr:xanthine dehydrogenase family protein subunit M [Ardenticatenaceae bacterium]HBY95491.1 carbon monoxide dehydrogenase [Chloroflexota bacterium]
MIPAEFQYAAPRTVPEAVALLQQREDAKILSGGQSLIPLMRFRLAVPPFLVDINRIPGLDYIRQADGWLRIGALVREADLEESALVREHYPLLHDTSRSIADPLVRNMATVAGNLAHADPANDHPAAMLAARAELVATGPNGERIIPIDDFFTDIFTSALAPDEILTEVRIPVPPAPSGGAYVKLERKVGDYATAGVAVQLSLAADGKVEQIGIGLTNVGPMALRARRSEEVLRGQMPSEALIAQAGRFAQEDCEPTADLRGSEEYKRNVVRVLTMRALQKALQRAAA